MKKIILLVAVFVITIGFSNQAIAQNFKGLDKSPMDIASFPSNYRVSEKVIKIIYSRPQLKGRSLEKLAPLGKKWRTGANEAVEITFYRDVTFGGKAVKAGTYSLFTIPSEAGDWTVIINSARNVWGSYFYKQDQDVVRVSGTVSRSEKSIEDFSILIDSDMTLKMGWGNTVVSVPIK